MASTPLLGLSLPADGTTNWGTLVNTSITALLDSAVAGTTTLTVDGDTILSDTQEVTNEARQAIILWKPLSGTATRTITAPAKSKTYVVINATGGTQSIIFRGSTPTTGVTIPAGKAYMLAWNGLDFIATGVTTVNLATDVTGILPGTNGGTGVNNTGKTITLGGNLTTSGAFDTTLTTSAVTNVTLPTTGTLATLAGSETLTNKTINGPDNTLTNIANASLANSAITINGNSVSLGGSTTVTAATTNAVTFNNAGTGDASGTTFNGSAARTISYNTVGAPSTTGTGATGTWSININGTVGATTPDVGTFSRLRTGVSSSIGGGTLTPPSDTVNQWNIQVTGGGTSTFAAPSGTPVDSQKLLIRITDNGTAQALAWNAIYRAVGTTLPTTTVANKTTYVGCIYNSDVTKWDVVAVVTQV